MALSIQRVRIALSSFHTLRAAARSIGVKEETLTRFVAANPELSRAYQECVSGLARRRASEEKRITERARERPRVTVRQAEKRKARFFAAIGRDPRIAAAALNKRLNHERRQDKAAALEEAIDAVDDLIAGRPLRPIVRAHHVIDRWCARCKSWRVDDPCDVCGMHTLEAR